MSVSSLRQENNEIRLPSLPDSVWHTRFFGRLRQDQCLTNFDVFISVLEKLEDKEPIIDVEKMDQ